MKRNKYLNLNKHLTRTIVFLFIAGFLFTLPCIVNASTTTLYKDYNSYGYLTIKDSALSSDGFRYGEAYLSYLKIYDSAGLWLGTMYSGVVYNDDLSWYPPPLTNFHVLTNSNSYYSSPAPWTWFFNMTTNMQYEEYPFYSVNPDIYYWSFNEQDYILGSEVGEFDNLNLPLEEDEDYYFFLCRSGIQQTQWPYYQYNCYENDSFSPSTFSSPSTSFISLQAAGFPLYHLVVGSPYTPLNPIYPAVEIVEPPLSIPVDSDITSNTTWFNNIPYVVSGDIEIESGVTLTIEPHAVIKFTPGSSLIANGTLISEGELTENYQQNEIYFTSIKDDIRNDTNEDEDLTSPSAGDWDGILINQGGEASFEYTTIQYAGGGASEAQIHNNGGELSMEHSLVIHGTDYGIKSSGGNSNIVNYNEITDHDYGIFVEGGSVDLDEILKGPNIIHDNNDYGVYNSTVSEIDAENNYWGDWSGPGGVGLGLGDHVSAFVDYDPWEEDPHFFNIFGDSVDNGEVRLEEGDTIYFDEVEYVAEIWNSYNGPVEIINNIPPAIPTLQVEDIDDSSSAGAGYWNNYYNPDRLVLNQFYLETFVEDKVTNVILHELGHAMGLGHSYTNNIMYYAVSTLTTPSFQDLFDYYSLTP